MLLRRVSALGRALVAIWGLALCAPGEAAHAAVRSGADPAAARAVDAPATAAHTAAPRAGASDSADSHSCLQRSPADAAQPAIEAREGDPAHELLGGKPTELVTIELRPTMHSPAGEGIRPDAHRVPPRHGPADTLRWCDVIQCRRLGGALLLGFATPPPGAF